MAINVKEIAEINLDKIIIAQMIVDQVTQGQSTNELAVIVIDNESKIITEN